MSVIDRDRVNVGAVRGAARLDVLVACGLFAAASAQRPFFSENQNTYFIGGLRNSDYGFLSADWFSNLTDPMPAFSALLAFCNRMDAVWLLYYVFGGLAGIYAVSLLILARAGTAGEVGRQLRLPAIWSRAQNVVFLALLTLLFCWTLYDAVLVIAPGGSWFVELAQRIANLASSGVASQSLLGTYIQPSAFGVLLLVGVALFVRERPYWAVVAITAAGTIHPTYVLHAGILTFAFCCVLLHERRWRDVVQVGALAALLILPILVYVLLNFASTNAEATALSNYYLADRRMSHHTVVAEWLTPAAMLQIALVIGGIAATFRTPRLFGVLAIAASLVGLLTMIQALSGSRGLALLFPWRAATWLVPAATAILLGQLVAWMFAVRARRHPAAGSHSSAHGDRMLGFTATSVLLVGALIGVAQTIDAARAPRFDALTRCAQANARAGQGFLVPVGYSDFRLATGIPIFVDWKSHPYRDVEVLEWWDRLFMAHGFYRAPSDAAAIRQLHAIGSRQRLTHVIAPNRMAQMLQRNGLRLVAVDGSTSLLEMPATPKAARIVSCRVSGAES